MKRNAMDISCEEIEKMTDIEIDELNWDEFIDVIEVGKTPSQMLNEWVENPLCHKSALFSMGKTYIKRTKN